MKLRIVPTDLKTANEFVRALHRHSRPVVGHRFAVGVADESGKLRGVAIVGRPVAPRLDNGFAAEITRLCTDGTRNACSSANMCSARRIFARRLSSIAQVVGCGDGIDTLAGVAGTRVPWLVVTDHLALERPQVEPGTQQSNLQVPLFGLGGRNELRDF